jgi:hypothetical protein
MAWLSGIAFGVSTVSLESNGLFDRDEEVRVGRVFVDEPNCDNSVALLTERALE